VVGGRGGKPIKKEIYNWRKARRTRWERTEKHRGKKKEKRKKKRGTLSQRRGTKGRKIEIPLKKKELA